MLDTRGTLSCFVLLMSFLAKTAKSHSNLMCLVTVVLQEVQEEEEIQEIPQEAVKNYFSSF